MSNFSIIWSFLGHVGLFLGASLYSSSSFPGVEVAEINRVFGNSGQNFIEVSIGSPLSDNNEEKELDIPAKKVIEQPLENSTNHIKSSEIVQVKKNVNLKKEKKNLEEVRTTESGAVQEQVAATHGLARLGSEGENSNSQVTYRDMFFAKILSEKRYPEKARKRQIEGSGFLEISLDRAGRVTNLNLLKSTGSELLDEEIFSLIKRSEPFPQLPNDLTEFKARLPIEFSLSSSR